MVEDVVNGVPVEVAEEVVEGGKDGRAHEEGGMCLVGGFAEEGWRSGDVG